MRKHNCARIEKCPVSLTKIEKTTFDLKRSFGHPALTLRLFCLFIFCAFRFAGIDSVLIVVTFLNVFSMLRNLFIDFRNSVIELELKCGNNLATL